MRSFDVLWGEDCISLAVSMSPFSLLACSSSWSQGCDLASNRDKILSAISETFELAASEGFDPKRVEALLHRTELALKEKNESFGLTVIMGATHAWNHDDEDPTKNLHINENVQQFR